MNTGVQNGGGAFNSLLASLFNSYSEEGDRTDYLTHWGTIQVICAFCKDTEANA